MINQGQKWKSFYLRKWRGKDSWLPNDIKLLFLGWKGYEKCNVKLFIGLSITHHVPQACTWCPVVALQTPSFPPIRMHGLTWFPGRTWKIFLQTLGQPEKNVLSPTQAPQHCGLLWGIMGEGSFLWKAFLKISMYFLKIYIIVQQFVLLEVIPLGKNSEQSAGGAIKVTW